MGGKKLHDEASRPPFPSVRAWPSAAGGVGTKVFAGRSWTDDQNELLGFSSKQAWVAGSESCLWGEAVSETKPLASSEYASVTY